MTRCAAGAESSGTAYTTSSRAAVTWLSQQSPPCLDHAGGRFRQYQRGQGTPEEIVAGASRGLGKACARALADEGARVFICSRNAEKLKRTAAELVVTGYSAADVSRPDGE